jgi:hypothetical protein
MPLSVKDKEQTQFFQGTGKEILLAVVSIFLQLRYLIFYMAIVIVANAVNYPKGKILIQNFP